MVEARCGIVFLLLWVIPVAFAEDLIMARTESSSTTAPPQRVQDESSSAPDPAETNSTEKVHTASSEPVLDKVLAMIDRSYDASKPYYLSRWSDSLFSQYGVKGLADDFYRYGYRYHIPVWKMTSLALGFDTNYLGFSHDFPPSLNPATGQLVEGEVSGHYLALALGGRIQAGFDFGILSLTPFIDYSSDLIAKSLITIEGSTEYEDGTVEDGGLNRRFTSGLSLYIDLAGVSVGVGFERGTLNGDFGSSVSMNGVHLSIRSQ
jgi:hypothetical protein